MQILILIFTSLGCKHNKGNEPPLNTVAKNIPIRNENDSRKYQLVDNSSLSGNNNVNLNSDEYINTYKNNLELEADFNGTQNGKGDMN